jgi:hypothetical protein
MRKGTCMAGLALATLPFAGCSQTEAKKDEPAKAPAAAPAAAPVPAPKPAPAAAPAPAPAPAPASRKPITVPLDSFEALGDVIVQTGDNVLICSNGVAEAKVKIPADGEYDIVLTLSGDEALNVLPKFQVRVDGAVVGKETLLKSAEAKPYTVRATLAAGTRRLGVEFTNDEYKENEYDRNLRIEEVAIKPAN